MMRGLVNGIGGTVMDGKCDRCAGTGRVPSVPYGLLWLLQQGKNPSNRPLKSATTMPCPDCQAGDRAAIRKIEGRDV